MISSAFLNSPEKKLRSTVYRRALTSLFQSDTSFSVPALMAELEKQQLTPNKTTLYREIETLLQEGLLEQIQAGNGGAQLYKGVKKQGHYHHIICKSCSKVLDVEVPGVESALYQTEQDLTKHTDFTISGHSLTFSGTCSSCLPAGK
jgi:Fur family ferric uptake transcriptional regulator